MHSCEFGAFHRCLIADRDRSRRYGLAACAVCLFKGSGLRFYGSPANYVLGVDPSAVKAARSTFTEDGTVRHRWRWHRLFSVLHPERRRTAQCGFA